MLRVTSSRECHDGVLSAQSPNVLQNSICTQIIVCTDRILSPRKEASRNRVWPWTRARNPVPTELSGPAPKIVLQHARVKSGRQKPMLRG